MTLGGNAGRDDASIRRYIGAGDVVDLLTARIDALPPDSVKLLEIMACLGGKVELSLLQAAAACSASEDVSVKFVSGVDR